MSQSRGKHSPRWGHQVVYMPTQQTLLLLFDLLQNQNQRTCKFFEIATNQVYFNYQPHVIVLHHLFSNLTDAKDVKVMLL